jgi:prefoldin subunit 5
MSREWIDALETEKSELKAEIASLRRLEPEKARLEEALSNAETNSIVATALIAIGGFLVSYATFTGKSAEFWANIAAGCLLSGIVILLAQSIRRWRRG